MSTRIAVAVVGVGFGAAFAPIYRDHPGVREVVLCDTRPDLLKDVADRLGIDRVLPDLDAVLADKSIDAVHLATPIPLHGPQSIASLSAGKHVACAVPAAVDLADLKEIVRLQAASGRNFMMMETAVYSREFIHVNAMHEAGEFGTLSFGRGAHFQNMEGWPPYWEGLPPMFYMTHAVAPLLALLDTRATSVRCLGSGRLPSAKQRRWSNPFPVETAIFILEGSDVAIEVSRALFQAVRAPVESFSIYGDRASFEWAERLPEEGNLFFDDSAPVGRRLTSPDRPDLLPETIRMHTRRTSEYVPGLGSVMRGGGHGGSHPHLVHEFVSSIVQGRLPWIDAARSADWTAAGVVAHRSAIEGGAVLDIPCFA